MYKPCKVASITVTGRRSAWLATSTVTPIVRWCAPTLEAFERTIAARELRKCFETHDSFPRDLWSSRTTTAANSSNPRHMSVLREVLSVPLILRSRPQVLPET